ncbi:MAG: PAS domain S-box protein [Nitrospinaceae bacterium]
MKSNLRQRMEEVLSESEKLHSTILDNAFDAIISMDEKGMVTDWNRRAETIFGWSVQEIIGKKLSEIIIPPQYHEDHERGFHRFLETGETRVLNRQIEITALHRDGHEFPIEISISASQWSGSYIFTGIIRDITERRNAEELARLRTEEYKILHEAAKALHGMESMESMLKGVMKTICFSHGLKLKCRSAVFLADENGKTLRLFCTLGDFPPDFLERAKEVPYADCLQEMNGASPGLAAIRQCLIDPDHEQQFKEMTGHGIYIVPLKRQKQLIGVLLLYGEEDPPRFERNKEILLSIGNLIANAIAHRRSEKCIESLSKFPEENPSPVFRIDGEGRLLYGNSAAEPLFHHWGFKWGKKVTKPWGRRIRQVFNAQTRQEIEIPFKNRLFLFEITPVPERNYVNIYGRDITERRKAQKQVSQKNQELMALNEKLKELNEYKNQFLGMASHDLRNPIQQVLSYSEIMKEGYFGPVNPRQMDVLEKIFNASEFMRALLDQLLNISNIERGKIRLEKIEQDFNAVTSTQVELNRFLADKKGITLELHRGEIPPIRFDKNAIIQVMGNLIGNAIKFSPSNTRIFITTQKPGSQVRFSVRDEGPGLSEADQKLTFQEFKTLTAQPTGDEISTGLGLAITKKLVRLHGGQVGLSSELGKGSTFFFTLPLH